MLLASGKALFLLSCIPIGFSGVLGANIICFFSTPSRSHYVQGEVLMIALAEKGHEVTMVSPYKLSKPIPNYKEIVLDDAQKILTTIDPLGSENLFESRNMPVHKIILNFLQFEKVLINYTLYHPEVQYLIKSGAKFDLFISEVLSNAAIFGLAHHFGAITVAFNLFSTTTKLPDEMVGNPNNPAYNPRVMTPFTANMNYWQRMANTVLAVADDFLYSYNMKDQDLLYKEVLKDVSTGLLPDLSTLVKNVSLVLVNTHVAVGYPRANVPNIVDVGGIHIKEGELLPKNLQEFLDSAKDGVIYFSMGGNLQSAQLPIEKREAFIKVFSNLKQKVLWKWEDDTLPGKPDNVFIFPWIPQQSILGHPNVRCFITHGGVLSTTEAVYFGVPIVGIPIFGDQYLNMVKAVTAGYAIQVSFDDLNEETLFNALNSVLMNPSYQNKVKSLSRIFRDEPTTALQRAVYSVEYVLRHKGALFLRSPSLNLNCLQNMLLDVIAGLTIIIALLIGIPYFVIRSIYRKICSKEQKLNQDHNKKKRN